MNNQIIWTKKYNVYHEKGHFKIFVTEHLGERFYSSVFYFVETGSVAKGKIPNLDFKLKTFSAKDKLQAFELSKNWIDDNLKGKNNISESAD
ncbi:MAG: hypothetical protein WC209_09295 [Ignavibacteriaceae bacterium]|jgi:hypothetical protein